MRILFSKLRTATRISACVDSDRHANARVFEIHRGPPTTVALHVEGPVQGDPVEPREEFAAPLELAEFCVGTEERILRDVVGVAPTARHVEGERENTRPVALHELIKSLGISGPCGLDQGGRLTRPDLDRALTLSGGPKPRGWRHAA